MTSTSSILTSQHLGQRVETQNDADSCSTCAAPVEMTMTVLLKNKRIVGCPACDWGVHSTAKAADGAGVRAAA